MKNYGLQIEKDRVYPQIFGGKKEVLKADGQWDEFLPEYEPQFGDTWDSHGCVVWGWENAIEIMLKSFYGNDFNYSERFPYIMAKVRPPGADPIRVGQVVQDHGLIVNESLPMTQTFEEFITPDPMEKRFIKEGEKWLTKFDFRFTPFIPTPELIKEYLQYSPVPLGVTAWQQDADGFYIDCGLPNTHWCVCYGYFIKDWRIFFKVFDSYDHSTKVLHPDHHSELACWFSLTPKVEQLSICSRFGSIIKSWLSLTK